MFKVSLLTKIVMWALFVFVLILLIMDTFQISFKNIHFNINTNTILLLLLLIVLPLIPYIQSFKIGNNEIIFRQDIAETRKILEQDSLRIEEKIKNKDGQDINNINNTIRNIEYDVFSMIENDDIAGAMFKIRYSIEEKLKEILKVYKIKDVGKNRGIAVMLRYLREHDIIDPSTYYRMRQVIDICNKAIHNGEISKSTALMAADMGSSALRYLEYLGLNNS